MGAEFEPWLERSAFTDVRARRRRRLRGRFPHSIATHNPVQTFYQGCDLRLRRHDYDPEVLGRAPVARYCTAWVNVDGLSVPTGR